MNKFQILLEYEQGTLTLSEAAKALGAKNAADVLRSLVAYRHDLPYLIDVSSKLAEMPETQGARRALVEQVARRLGITPRQVNRMMHSIGIGIPITYKVMIRVEKNKEAVMKWNQRTKAALSVISGADSMESAADYAEVTSRQMYRWVSKLLATVPVALMDLRQMSLSARKALADSIEAECHTIDQLTRTSK